MNFVVLGAGAIACYLSGRLAAGGRRVTLVGRPKTIELLASTGLTVSDVDGFRAHVPAYQITLASSLAAVNMAPPSVIVLCVSGGATESAALEINACCPTGTTVVSLQDGMDNVARIRAIAPRMRILPGVASYQVVMPSASHAQRSSAGGLFMASSDVTQEMALLLNACGVATRLVKDMRPWQWGKLLLDLGNPVNAWSDLPPHAQVMDRDHRRMLAGLQSETLDVLQRARIKPAKLTGAPPSLLPYLLRLPNWIFARVGARLLRFGNSGRSALADELQPVLATGMGERCAAVMRLAAQHGITAPRNAAMCRLVAEQQRDGRLTGPEKRKKALP